MTADHYAAAGGAGLRRRRPATGRRGRYPRAAAGRPVVDDAVAAFVLNHLTDPSAGLAELARVTRPGGAVLASVSSTTSGDPARDRIDAVAQDGGWQIAAWYTQLKTTAVPTLGGAAAMATTARPTGGPSGRTAADRRASRGQ